MLPWWQEALPSGRELACRFSLPQEVRDFKAGRQLRSSSVLLMQLQEQTPLLERGTVLHLSIWQCGLPGSRRSGSAHAHTGVCQGWFCGPGLAFLDSPSRLLLKTRPLLHAGKGKAAAPHSGDSPFTWLFRASTDTALTVIATAAAALWWPDSEVCSKSTAICRSAYDCCATLRTASLLKVVLPAVETVVNALWHQIAKSAASPPQSAVCPQPLC